MIWVLLGLFVLLVVAQPRNTTHRPTEPPENPVPPSGRPAAVIPPSDGTGDNSVTRSM